MPSPRFSLFVLHAIVVSLRLATGEAADTGYNTDLLNEGVSQWRPSSRVARCPVHSNLQPVAADGGKGVEFSLGATSPKRFSLIETYLPAGGLQGYGGLQLNYTTTGLGPWELRLYDAQTNLRFVHSFRNDDGVHSATLPWTSFRGTYCRRRKSRATAYTVQPSSISRLELYLPNAGQAAKLALKDMYAMRDLSAMVSDTSTPTAILSGEDDMAAVMDYFDGPFVGMGITGHNDFGMMEVSKPVECAEECAKTPGCISFDYGAREKTLGECWLSLADRKSAGHAYTSWRLYDYYELKPEGEAAAGTGMGRSSPSLGRDGASHAWRLASTTVARVLAFVALAFALAF